MPADPAFDNIFVQMRAGNFSGRSRAKSESQTPVAATGSNYDKTRIQPHMKGIGTFIKRIEEAATRAFPKRGRLRYKEVIAILLCWEENDQSVPLEIEKLHGLFDSCYGFHTETWKIPSKNSDMALMGFAVNCVEKFGSAESLFIIYYSGLAEVDASSKQSTWWCNRDPRSPSVRWSAIQRQFEESKSDALFLLDCCPSVGATPGRIRGVNETISAYGFEASITNPGQHSFADALIKVLEKWNSRHSFSAAMLHSEMTASILLDKPEQTTMTGEPSDETRTPFYLLRSSDPRANSLELAQRRGPDTPSRSNTNFSLPAASPITPRSDAYNPVNINKILKTGELQVPHVLISVALEEDRTLDVHAWYASLREIPAIATYAVIEGVYKSHSTMLLLSIPLIIWDLLPEDLAVSFVGYVQSKNLLAAESLEDFHKLAGTKQVAKTRAPKFTTTRPPHLRSTSLGDQESRSIDPPPLSAVKPHPLSIVDSAQVAEARKRSVSQPEAPKIIDIKPPPASSLKPAPLQLPQRTNKPDTPPPSATKLPTELDSSESQSTIPTSSFSTVPSSTFSTVPTSTFSTASTTSSFAPDVILDPLTIPKSSTPPPISDSLQSQSATSPSDRLIKELITSARLAREEAARAWEELGRREREDRLRLSALRAGEPVFINNVQVVAATSDMPRPNSKAEAVLGGLIGTLNSTSARTSLEEKARASLDERRPMMYEGGEWKMITDENRPPPARRGRSFVEHKAQKLYPAQPPVIPTSKTFTPLTLNPTNVDVEAVRLNNPSDLDADLRKLRGKIPSPPHTPERKKIVDGAYTFLDDEDETRTPEVEVKRRASKLVKKRRASASEKKAKGKKEKSRESSVTRW